VIEAEIVIVFLIFVSCQNPSKPHFNHFLFESICIVISTTCKLNPAAVSSFEDGLFPPFQEILQQDVQGYFLHHQHKQHRKYSAIV
jgi:hypothetical protein